MKNHQKLFGIGLPRTGSTSLAEALRILSYKGSNFCSLNNIHTSDETEAKKSFEIDNSFFKIYQHLFKKNPNAKFILTTRDNSSWRKSMSGFEYDNNILPNINKYADEVENFFKSRNAVNQLLLINLSELNNEEKWKRICDFLNEKNIPDITFPHISIKVK